MSEPPQPSCLPWKAQLTRCFHLLSEQPRSHLFNPSLDGAVGKGPCLYHSSINYVFKNCLLHAACFHPLSAAGWSLGTPLPSLQLGSGVSSWAASTWQPPPDVTNMPPSLKQGAKAPEQQHQPTCGVPCWYKWTF